MGWLHEYLQRLVADRFARRLLEVRFAENVVVRGGRLSLVAGALKALDGGRKSYAQPSLKWSPFLRELRERTTLVGTRWGEVVDWVAERFSIDAEAADAQLMQLRELGFLLFRLEPPLTDDALGAILSYLPEGLDERRGELESVASLCDAFDRSPARERVSAGRALDAGMREILPSSGETIQVDGFVGVRGTLNRSVAEDLEPLIATYVRCSRRLHLTKFREEFVRRYEGTDARVPLLEIADPDDGLADHIVVEKDDAVRAEPRRAYELARLVDRASRSGSRVVRLSVSELETLLPPAPDDALTLPASADFGFQLFAADNAAIDEGRYIVSACPYVYSDAAGRGSGRFVSELGADVLPQMERTATASLPDDAVVAELVYRPMQERSQNVAIRRTWCAYRIHDGYPAEGDAAMIPLSDLYVGIHEGRMALFSARLQRRVTLHQNHVLNMALAPPISRALIAFSLDERRALEAFDWGPFANIPFLPRLQVGRTIVSPARWRLPRSTAIADDGGASLAAFRSECNVPRLVYLKELDARLAIDLDSALGRRILADQSRAVPADGFIELEEAALEDGDVWLSDGTASFASEFVVSASRVVRDARPAAAEGFYPPLGASRVSRDDRWLYLRIVVARSRQDLVLRDHVARIVGGLRERGRVGAWFFLRYGAPDHLRLRLHCTDGVGAIRDEVIAALVPLSHEAVIAEFELAQYKPELERYADALDVAHQLFHWSSEWALSEILAGTPEGRVARATVAFQLSVVEALPAELRAAWLADARADVRVGTKADRAILKALRDRPSAVQPPRMAHLGDAIADVLPRSRLVKFVRDLFHLHFNRCGLSRSDENAAYATLVSANYGFSRQLAC